MNDIKVGDLVEIRYPQKCCGANKSKGNYFMVTGFYSGESMCSRCVRKTNSVTAIGFNYLYTPLYRLRKVPPLDELEDTNIKETMEV